MKRGCALRARFTLRLGLPCFLGSGSSKLQKHRADWPLRRLPAFSDATPGCECALWALQFSEGPWPRGGWTSRQGGETSRGSNHAQRSSLKGPALACIRSVCNSAAVREGTRVRLRPCMGGGGADAAGSPSFALRAVRPVKATLLTAWYFAAFAAELAAFAVVSTTLHPMVTIESVDTSSAPWPMRSHIILEAAGTPGSTFWPLARCLSWPWREPRRRPSSRAMTCKAQAGSQQPSS